MSPIPTKLILDQACDFIIDCLHKTAPIQDEGFPLIRTPNIGRGRFNLEGVQRISKETYEVWTSRAIPQKNDLILAREAPAGNVAIIKSDEPYCLGQRTVHLRPNPEIVNPDFLVYFLLAPAQQSLLLKNQVGVHVGHVNMRDIRSLPLIDLPSMEEQNRIAAILSAYDDLIENNNRRIVLLEESARLLYREWFVRLRFPGYENTRITDGVPEGWERKPLEEICYQHKKSVKPSDIIPGTPYIGLAQIPRRSITLSEWEYADVIDSNKFEYEKGDILFGKIRPYFHKVGFTLCDGVTSSDAIVIRPYNEGHYSYLLMHVSSDMFVSLASKTVKEGSKMPRADWNYLTKQPILVPSAAINDSFTGIIKPILKQLETLASQNQKLKAARDLLLPKLMNGEIPV